jgi:CheY-like chemotaxis protein
MALQPRQRPGDAKAPPPHLARVVSRSTLRVLVVDDERDACEGLALLMEFEGYRVETALDGATGLSCAERFTPDVVLLDLAMPRMSGHEVARALRRHPASRDALIIALSGLGERDDIERSRAAGFDHHQVKPVNIDALLAMIDRHFAQPTSGSEYGG